MPDQVRQDELMVDTAGDKLRAASPPLHSWSTSPGGARKHFVGLHAPGVFPCASVEEF